MQKWMNTYKKNNSGYTSIELVVIGSLIIGFGAMSIGLFNDESVLLVNNSTQTIESKFEVAQMKLK